MSIRREQVVAEARLWLGTPYHHQASLRGVGADCLGLVRGIEAFLAGREVLPVPPYTPGWAENSGQDPLLEAARRHLVERTGLEFMAGDVLLFRFRPDLPTKHMAVAVSADSMIHAYERAAVAETCIGSWWRRRLAAVFSFSGVETP